MSTKPCYTYVRADQIKPGDYIMLGNHAYEVIKTNPKHELKRKLIRIHIDSYHRNCLYRADQGVKTPIITKTEYELTRLKYVYSEEEKEIRVTLQNETELREDVFLSQIYPGCSIEAAFLRGETISLTILKTGEVESIM